MPYRWIPKATGDVGVGEDTKRQPCPRGAYFPRVSGGVNQAHVRGSRRPCVLVRYAPLLDHPALVQADIVVAELVHLVLDPFLPLQSPLS